MSEMKIQGTEAQLKIALKDVPPSMLPNGIQGGDTKIIWNPVVTDEVEAARATFENLRAKGYAAFDVSPGGEQAGPMKVFNPQAGKLIMTPPLRGGL